MTGRRSLQVRTPSPRNQKNFDFFQPAFYNRRQQEVVLMAAVETVRLGSKCQMVLPLKVRRALGVSEGDELLVLPLGRTVVLVPKPERYAERLLGLHREIWEGVDPGKLLEEERNSWES